MTADDADIVRLEERITALRRDLARQEDEVVSLKVQAGELTATINGHAQKVALLTPEYKAIRDRLDRVEAKQKEISEEVSDLDRWRQRVIGMAMGASALTSGTVWGFLEAVSRGA